MIKVQDKENKLCVIGHAAPDENAASDESRDVCVSVTALTKMLICGLSSYDNPKFVVKPGKFVLDKTGLSKKSLFLTSVFVKTIEGLVHQHYEYIRLYGDDGKELISVDTTDNNEDVYKPLFPDWRDYVV